MPEFIDLVFAKISPKRSFPVIENERFGLVFAKTGSVKFKFGHRRDGSWVVRLLAMAALWVRIQTSLKNTNGRHIHSSLPPKIQTNRK